jgi:hypothetical protein
VEHRRLRERPVVGVQRHRRRVGGFGDGAWLVDVQAHGSAYWVDSEVVGGVTYNREAGQLLLMKLPGT